MKTSINNYVKKVNSKSNGFYMWWLGASEFLDCAPKTKKIVWLGTQGQDLTNNLTLAESLMTF